MHWARGQLRRRDPSILRSVVNAGLPIVHSTNADNLVYQELQNSMNWSYPKETGSNRRDSLGALRPCQLNRGGKTHSSRLPRVFLACRKVHLQAAQHGARGEVLAGAEEAALLRQGLHRGQRWPRLPQAPRLVAREIISFLFLLTTD